MIKKAGIYSALLPVLLVLFTGSYQGGHFLTKPRRLLQIGEKMPMADYKMQDTNYNLLSLAMMKKSNGLLVLFTANTCDLADKWQGRYNMLAQTCATYQVGMIAVNANAALINGPASIRKNRERSDKYHYRFPYVSDNQDQLTDAFGVRQIPMVFLFDKNMKLVYRGAIDDNPNYPAKVKHHYVLDAITSLGNGRPVPRAITRLNGCPVMRETD